MASSNVNHLSQPCIYERKSGLMKWIGKLFKGEETSSGRTVAVAGVGDRSQFIGDENMSWRRAPVSFMDERSRIRKEKEELDRAIALSLAEDFRRANGGYKWRTNNDEDYLSSSLHENFNPTKLPPCVPRGYRVCGGCKREIGQGNYLGCMGTFFHPECFKCHACGYPITELEFSLSGKDMYHKFCFKELTHPKCEVCHQYIPTNRNGLIEYRCHPFWEQKYCPSHEHDNNPRCCSCERLESRNTKYVLLGDGRSLCLECMESAIMDTGDCQPLYHAIRDYYEGMNMRIEQQIPMLLVERQALNEAIEGEKHGYHHMPETRGLCLSEEQTVTSILRRPRMERRGLVGLRTQPHKLTRRCEVTAILVLYGLPRLLTGAILAHELMHGWLRLNGYRNLRPEVEEGICQVLAHMWLESEVPIPAASRSTPSTSAASSSSSGWSYGSTNVPFSSAASLSSRWSYGSTNMPSSSGALSSPGSTNVPFSSAASSSSRWSYGSTNMPSSSGALSSPRWPYGSTSMPTTSATSSSSTSKKGGKSSVENKLGEFFMHQIAHDASPAYGEGYRAGMKAVNKYGLRATLDHIRYTGTFPE